MRKEKQVSVGNVRVEAAKCVAGWPADERVKTRHSSKYVHNFTEQFNICVCIFPLLYLFHQVHVFLPW